MFQPTSAQVNGISLTTRGPDPSVHVMFPRAYSYYYYYATPHTGRGWSTR